MSIWHALRFSAQTYLCPIKPRPGERPRFWRGSPAHEGPFKHARDIIIPDPRSLPLPIYAPADGWITRLVQSYNIWGDDGLYRDYLNYITVEITGGEFYEICHIAEGSCPHAIGDSVTRGEIIATTGLNGWITLYDGKPACHTHVLVGIPSTRFSQGFESVRIRWQKAAVYI